MKSTCNTPFKQRKRGQRLFAGFHESDDIMDAVIDSLVESPPSPGSQRSVLRQATRSRLFGEDDCAVGGGDREKGDADNQGQHKNNGNFRFLSKLDKKFNKSTTRDGGASGGPSETGSRRPKILKPLDLNLSFDDEDTMEFLPFVHSVGRGGDHPVLNDAVTSALSHQDKQRCKRLQRLAEIARRESQTPTRTQATIDPDNVMAASPYLSPSSYITMDGRCVTSKNPFSPMVTGDSTPASVTGPSSFAVSRSRTHTNGAAPSFPVSFETSSDHAPPACHRLQKRDASTWASPSKRSSLYSSFTRDGYPERSGRYSFTGSPIKEDEENTKYQMDISTSSNSPSMMAAASKIRRLGLNDDVHYPNCGSGRQHDLTVETDNTVLAWSSSEEISPTDVLSFPAPPTPTKSTKSNNPYPLVSHPPDTPFISRSGRRPRRRMPHSNYGSELDDTNNSCSSYQSYENESIMKPTTSRFRSDFDIIGALGKGSFGAVYKVLSQLDGCMYAVKTALRKVKGNADRDRMLKEVYALAALSDQADPATFHIVRYHQAWMEDDRLYIQTELCSSNLFGEIELSGGRLSEERRYKLLREMLLALEFIHREGMCHLDIKPENIFVKTNVFKLGDFGLVTKIAYHKDVEEGDSRYMSMELLSGDHSDLTKSDIFSLGATLYEICLGKPLPMNGSEWQAIRAGSLQPLPETPYEMEMIIREMMNPTFPYRPSALDLLKQPQLLSKEQKLLISERNKVFLLLKQTQPVGLARRNTWSGGH